jgi:hypothetical protein
VLDLNNSDEEDDKASRASSALFSKYRAAASARSLAASRAKAQPLSARPARAIDPHASQVEWSNLGERIEDWFAEAKSPEQKVVYRFLRNLKSEQRNDQSSALSESSSLSERASNLEDILNNLKRQALLFFN